MIEVVPYTDELRASWDSFVPKCKNATFLHLRSYMDYHKDRFSDCSTMIYQDGRLVGLVPANLKSDNTVVSHEGLTYGGLLVASDEYSDNTVMYLAEILKFYEECGSVRLFFRQIPSFYTDIPCGDIDYALCLADAHLYRVDINSVIDLSLSSRPPLQRRRKTGVKLAEKNNIRVVEAPEFDGFWNEILIPNLQSRHSAAPVHNLSEMKRLRDDNPGRIRQFNALSNDRIMAGCTVFDFDRVVRIQYFSGCDEGRANGSLDYLIYKLMTEYFPDRHYMDFGNSNADGFRRINHGLLGWKEGFGARSFVQRFYEVETKNHTMIAGVFDS